MLLNFNVNLKVEKVDIFKPYYVSERVGETVIP